MEHGRAREGKSLRVLIAATRGQTAAKCLDAGCPEDQRLRKRFGCDDSTGEYGVDCLCGGERSCRICRGSGQEPIDRCPVYHARRVHGIDDFFDALRRSERWHALPVAGGVSDQANVFLAAADVVKAAKDSADARDRRKQG